MKNLLVAGLLSAGIFSCNKDDKRSLVVDHVKNTAGFATTETIIDKIVLGTRERKLLNLIKINKAYFAAETHAVITTGINIDKLEENDIKIEKKRIAILLPHVEVLDFSYPFSSYKIDSTITRNAFLNKMDVLDHEKFYLMAELNIRNNLKYTGIREATEAKTRILFEGLLKNLGYEEIHLRFKEGELIKEIAFENEPEE